MEIRKLGGSTKFGVGEDEALILDQTTPQTITGGQPTFNNGIKQGTPAGTYLANVGGVNATDIVNSDNGYRILYVTRPTFTNANLALITGEGGNLDASATYHYSVTFVTAVGETNIQSGSASIATTADDRKVRVTVPVSPDYRVTSRKIYRSVGGGGQFTNYLIATIADNTTTIFDDDVADTTSGANSYFRDNTTAKWSSGSITFMTPGNNNTRFGQSAGSDTATGGRNAFFGNGVFFNITTTNDNVGIGHGTGYLSRPSSTTAIGVYTLGAVNQASDVQATVAIGYQAMFTAFDATVRYLGYSVAVGNHAGGAGLGRYSVAVGYEAGRNTYNANAYNTFVGYQSARGGSGANGTSNSSLGALSGNATTTGSNCLWLGANSGRYSTTENGEFFVNTYNQTNRAGDIANSLMYGVMKANDPANQTLTVNGTFKSSVGMQSADGTAGATANVATLAPDGTTTRTLHFKNGLYTGYTDS
jgi:hypothetical protein